jgi:hypothetical protein
MKPWEHFQRPDEDDLECAIKENRAAMQKTQSMISSHISLDERATVTVEVCEKETVVAGPVDPDFYPNHIPAQYHEVSWWSRFIGLFKFRKVKT